MKRGIIILYAMIFLLSGCSMQHSDGPAIEVLFGTSQRDNRVYYIYEDTMQEVGWYNESFFGGTSISDRNRVQDLMKKENIDPFDEYGQLDAHYIDRNIEAYLFNKVGGEQPTLLLFENGRRLDMSLPNGVKSLRDIRYHDGSLYLLSTVYSESREVKVDLQTKEVEVITYKWPGYKSAMPHSYLRSGLLCAGEVRIRAFHLIKEKTEMLCISKPNGEFLEIQLSDDPEYKVAGLFETDDGFAVIASFRPYYGLDQYTKEDLFVTIQYFDMSGRELYQQNLDIELIQKQLDGTLEVASGLCYKDGQLYFAVLCRSQGYVYRFDLTEEELMFIGKADGWIDEMRPIEINGDMAYSVVTSPYCIE